MQSEIAVLRFGLGARPGELAAAADPKAWLKAQLHGAVNLASSQPLASSSAILQAIAAARIEQQQTRRESKAPSADAVKAFNAVREVYQPHYRAQVLARAQSAATTDRPFAERLVHFWANQFAVSAD